jgi:hypothetical protein
MKFFKKIVFFILFIILFFNFIIGCYVYKHDLSLEDIPAPKFTSSFSFNDKLEFSRNKKVEILSIGSSMSLNNLSSKIVVDRFNSMSYLNLSSWGIKLKTDFDLLKIQTKIQKIKSLILVSNIIDFTVIGKDELNENELNVNDIENYLKSYDDLKYHLEYFNLRYYFKESLLKKGYKIGRNFSMTLNYDEFGGALVEPEKFQYNKERWNSSFIKKIDLKYYTYLDSISNYCKVNNIQFFFFQSPTREKVLNQNSKRILQKHCEKVEKIILKSDGCFVNSNESKWNDSLFIDGIHLNKNGADQFSNYCFNRISY